MTYEERQAEIKRIEREEYAVLSHPLISEGNIDPDAISAMSDRKKKAWGKGADAKMGLLARIHALSRTDDELARIAQDKQDEARESRIGQIERSIEFTLSLGRMSHKKNGELKISYRRMVDRQRAELADLKNDKPAWTNDQKVAWEMDYRSKEKGA